MHLSKFESDYRPILVCFDKFEGRSQGNRLFWFLAAWLTHKSFTEFVASAWNPDTQYLELVCCFTEKLSQWNKESFGNIFQMKRRLLAKLGSIQKALELHESKGLIRLEMMLRKELEEVLSHEELLLLCAECGIKRTK